MTSLPPGEIARPATSAAVELRFRLNGRVVERTVEPGTRLVDFLRDDLGLTGTKLNCGIGVCGVCTVLVDGEAMTGCLLPVSAVAGRAVTTIEGLAGDGDPLTPVQRAFAEQGGFQCGICTPGQVLAATALLADDPDPDEETIRDYMTGNLCRCTGYGGIVASIRAAADALRRDPAGEPVATPAKPG